MSKIVNPVGRTFCKIEIENGNLSISGVERPFANGDCGGSCGQINPIEGNDFNNGWSKFLLLKFNQIWERWHLNDMRAGTFEQMEYLRLLGKPDLKCPMTWYDWACEELKEAGMYVVKHNGKDYTFGYGWIKEELPKDVIDFLESLPDTEIHPAWV